MNAPRKSSESPSAQDGLPRWFLLFAGTVFGLIFVKQGNPVIFAKLIRRPANVVELFFQFWPIEWGYQLLLVLGLATVLAWRRSGAKPRLGFGSPWPMRCLGLALAWFGWQALAATSTIQSDLTALALAQFAGCVGCLAFGVFVLREMKPTHAPWFWLPLVAAFAFSLWIGWGQHFGGLEEIRKQVLADSGSGTNSVAAGVSLETLRKKAMSDRIYGTFVYPNTFGGGIVLMLPITLAWLYTAGSGWPKALRFGSMLAFAGVGGACLVWSGSKSGWLISVVLGGLAIWLSRWKRGVKLGIIGTVVVLGLAAFGIRYSGYFQKGATSVEARFDYWRCAMEIARREPLFGTGPGTFQIPYQRMKDADAEMARLAHNDFLEQACDSGFGGFVLYAALIGSIGWTLYRQRSSELLPTAVLLGWSGIQLQSLSEFNLYIPGLAWLGFLLAGWLLSQNRFDTAVRQA